EHIIKQTVAKFGQLDVLVNNPGIATTGHILDIDVDQFDTILNTNLRAVFLLTKFAAPHLIKTQGNIVNVSSIAGLRSFPNVSVYCTSKAALDQFTRCIAVNPGVIITDIHKRMGMSAEEYEKYLEHCKTTHAPGRVGYTKEVADGIIFLASNTSSFITGATLPIDGGKHAMCPR
ncbi:PREDICTED: dihydroanticapsin 7-dehydrogenase-like, partial [Rhagoletis zephyria]|uniref:dihydroanticapsin 7-dehydrogenase-like n=1 Tax=Rhagoletis zephyria TaxID=28612 RepID=UPI00081157A5